MSNRTASRRFIVHRAPLGHKVIINEVAPGSHADEMDNAAAAAFAARLARPAKACPNRARRSQGQVIFIGLDGTTADVTARVSATPVTNESTSPVNNAPKTDVKAALAAKRAAREARAADRAEEQRAAIQQVATADQPSEGQVRFLTTLLTEREMDTAEIATFTRKTISARIDEVKALPLPRREIDEDSDLGRVVAYLTAKGETRNDFEDSLFGQFERKGSLSEKQIAAILKRLDQADRQTDLPQVPAGRYAVENEDGDLRFYTVRVSKSGFVTVDVHKSDDRIPLQFNAMKSVLAKIVEAGPREAAIRFGKETNHCGVCGRELTDEASREAGIGPVCATKGF